MDMSDCEKTRIQSIQIVIYVPNSRAWRSSSTCRWLVMICQLVCVFFILLSSFFSSLFFLSLLFFLFFLSFFFLHRPGKNGDTCGQAGRKIFLW